MEYHSSPACFFSLVLSYAVTLPHRLRCVRVGRILSFFLIFGGLASAGGRALHRSSRTALRHRLTPSVSCSFPRPCLSAQHASRRGERDSDTFCAYPEQRGRENDRCKQHGWADASGQTHAVSAFPLFFLGRAPQPDHLPVCTRHLTEPRVNGTSFRWTPYFSGASRRRSASSSSSSVAPQPQRALFQFAATSLLSTGGASWFPSSSCLTASRLPSAYPSVASCSDPPPAALPPLETFPLFPPPHEARSKGRLPNDGEGQRYVGRGRTGRGRTGHERPETRWSTEGHPSARQNADATAEFRAGEAVWQSPAFQLEGFKGIFPVVSPAHQKLLGLADQKDRSGSFFVAHIGGTQMIMERGRFYDVNRIHQKVGGRIHLHRIICYQAPDGEFWLGRPYLENVRATATIEKHFRGPKMHMAKARPKKWRKYFSHRQDLTRIRVTEVDLLRNPEEYESATLPPNFTTDDPIYAALTASKLFRKPSTVLPRMKRTFMRLASREEFPLVGDDPLMNFDPLVNRLLMDRLLAGHSDLFPLLRPETDMKRDWH